MKQQIQKIVEKLLSLGYTRSQLYRLYCRLDARMRTGQGYQPFGYDWPTLRMNNPGLYVAMKATLAALRTLTH